MYVSHPELSLHRRKRIWAFAIHHELPKTVTLDYDSCWPAFLIGSFRFLDLKTAQPLQQQRWKTSRESRQGPLHTFVYSTFSRKIREAEFLNFFSDKIVRFTWTIAMICFVSIIVPTQGNNKNSQQWSICWMVWWTVFPMLVFGRISVSHSRAFSNESILFRLEFARF